MPTSRMAPTAADAWPLARPNQISRKGFTSTSPTTTRGVMTDSKAAVASRNKASASDFATIAKRGKRVRVRLVGMIPSRVARLYGIA